MIEITEKMDLNGTIDDDVLLKDQADVKIYGIVNGDVHASHGTKLTVFGEINGSIVATDATVHIESGAIVRFGYSSFAQRFPKRDPFSHTQTDDQHLTTAIRKHRELLDELTQNHG